MEATRISTSKLKKAIDKAEKRINVALALLAPYLSVITFEMT